MAELITSPRSAFGSLRADSISATTVLTLIIAASVSGKLTALARYSPISAERVASFLRSSACFLALVSAIVVAARVAVVVAVKLAF